MAAPVVQTPAVAEVARARRTTKVGEVGVDLVGQVLSSYVIPQIWLPVSPRLRVSS